MSEKIKVLIVDDSAVVRQVLRSLLEIQADIEVIGTAVDPIFALSRMQKTWPDVILLDIEMPRMDGLTFLKKIMAERPTPVIMCSTHTEKGAEVTIEAMRLGAVSFITKPKLNSKAVMEETAADITQLVRAAAKARLSNIIRRETPAPRTEHRAAVPVAQAGTADIIAIGASTGGTQALEYLLTQLPDSLPGVVIVQHMPEHFTNLFAKRLDSKSQLLVKEAEHGDKVLPGMAFIAPGGKHLEVKRAGRYFQIEIHDKPPVNRHKPSVDVMFSSLCRSISPQQKVQAYLLTGMGDDGARGLLELFKLGAFTVAQDEATSVVYGMPKAAVTLGAASKVLPLPAILSQIKNTGSRAS
jgi:two-component system chemotaxis response regulator CheB